MSATTKTAWISKRKYMADGGFTNGQVRTWIRDCWERGVHFQVRGRTTVINVAEVDNWWAEGASRQSIEKAKPYASTRPATPIRKLTVPDRYLK